MLVDEYEQYNNDRPDVVNISPDDASEEPAEVEPMADDCTCNGLFLLSTSSDNLLGGTTAGVTSDILPSYPSHADVQRMCLAINSLSLVADCVRCRRGHESPHPSKHSRY